MISHAFVPETDTLSVVLGYTSLTCWLGAQFPQILENIRRQSVDGLALTFLANWMFGDITNLIGCILTHQLPFQTYVATYFCLVDIMLLGQYIYYTRPSRKPSPSLVPLPIPSDSPILETRPKSRSYSNNSAGGGQLTIRQNISQPQLRALSAAAANVAVVASELSRRPLAHEIIPSRDPLKDDRHEPSDEVNHADEEYDDEVAALTDSFHSDDPRGKGRSVSRGRPYDPASNTRLTASLTLPGDRGRALSRMAYDSSFEALDLSSPQDGSTPRLARTNSSKSRRRGASSSASASRRGASIVFFGVWALLGIGGWLQKDKMIPTDSTGVVLARPPLAAVVTSTAPLDISSFPLSEGDPHHPDDGHLPPPRSDATQWLIGRISAWTCATLYLTSRLPQIWKNFVRKSVEGLTMSLFICAFLGNTFYVASILTNPMLNKPPPIARAFFLESVPYLLGSAGTLMFDVTIVAQSFVYRGRKPVTASTIRRRRHLSRPTILDEEEALLPGPPSPEAGWTGPSGISRGRRKRYGSSAGRGRSVDGLGLIGADSLSNER